MQFLLIAVGCLAGVGLIMSMNGPLMVLGVFLLCFIFWRSAQAVGGPSWYVERESVPVDEGLTGANVTRSCSCCGRAVDTPVCGLCPACFHVSQGF
ncbi:MAG: hypothetical protein K2W95_25465 [Candidatus Obscuribacterales bacterium]|nr:hypothetical protein [Candidatus Obscuribacterales bacterium]